MDYFDQSAAGWDADPTKVERAMAVAQGIRASVQLSPNLSALEYGCGTGLLSFALQADLGQITLVDSSRGMLDVLEQKIASAGIHNMTPLRADFIIDPLPEAQVQLIYTLMTLHHIPDTDQILKSFYTLLDTPGYLCVADLDREDGSFHGHDFSGHPGFDRDELAEKAGRAGFKQVAFTTVFNTPREVGASVVYFPLFLMLATK
jgi:ubiquinone/menaquinone biosynthesis C-methylase UbiE